jgi:hypothetical protein
MFLSPDWKAENRFCFLLVPGQPPVQLIKQVDGGELVDVK